MTIITPITMKIAIIPESIYGRLYTNAIGLKPLNIHVTSYIKNLRIRPPAITDAI